MKTEKRLTMALSVLVALMMLAVPLASSSNLFVDGGQTNSNGDAPSLGAAGDTLTINLNIPENSLDTIDYTKLKTNLTTDHVVYSIDAKAGVIRAICIDETAVTIQTVLTAIENALKANDVANDRMKAYTVSWSGVNDKSAEIKGQTVDANWKLNSEDYAEININTTGLGNDSVMVKTYAYLAGSNKTEITIDKLPIDPEAGKGYVVNIANNTTLKSVYITKITAGSIDLTSATLPKTNVPVVDISVEYSFNSDEYRAISIESEIFEEPITLYAAKTSDAGTDLATFTYDQIYTLLKSVPVDSEYINVDDNNLATDKSYEVFNWTDKKDNENYALNSNSPAGYDLILNAEYKTFPVIFMVNGQAQLVYVQYGEFSEASCPFDTTGMTVWVKSDKSIFDFGMSSEALQEELIKSTENAPLTLIALFSDSTETVYVTFNAGTDAYFDADKKIDTIIVPVAIGTTADKIPVPVSPSKDPAAGKSYLFAYWATDDGEYEFKSTNKVSDVGLDLTANFVEYTFTINFFVDDNKYIVLYCNGDLTYDSSAKEVDVSKVTGALYDGKTYLAADIDADLTSKLIPTKAGYQLVQWNDKDGKMMLTLGLDKNGYVEVTNAGFSKISANTDLYAEFEAADYVIIYSGNTAAATNNMVQVGTVGEPLNFFSDATFSNDGYKLKEWNTRPDGKGTSYALGSSFTLNGEQFKGLSDVSKVDNVPAGITNGFTLYAIWEKSSSGSGSGDNTDGGDNNTDTYLLAGILAVIIILIILIAFLMRRKQ